ncbi:helix-turn-helix domain-containing protein [Bacillus salitolerans]|uniref:Helix-turn-helix domain-containing protein n=1 Tax=Bacillus salitolerans TaxID=1437434 RepID=A0ABW4LJJ2_9BACI
MSYISFRVPPFPTFIKGGEAVFSTGKKHFKRTFSVFDLLYVKSGTLFMVENNQKFDVEEGQYIILIPENEHYGYKGCEKETEFYWLHFVLEGACRIVDKMDLDWTKLTVREGTFEEPALFDFYIPQSGQISQRELLEQMLHQLVLIGNEQTPDNSLRQQTLFQELLLQLQKQALQIPSATERVCEDALKYIRENYQKPMKMTDMSGYLHFHPDYITRCVQKTIGINPSQYLNQYRIAQAKRLLATTNDKIAAICKEVGIEDQGYFSKLFKKLEGMSPVEYRRVVLRASSERGEG